jgi:3D (Asp-Asp-Asp) domain-containing protein/predicted  nucleic acid-binding Zn-ribbon protein
MKLKESHCRFRQAHREGPVRHEFRRVTAVPDTCNRRTPPNFLDFDDEPAESWQRTDRTKSGISDASLCYGPALVEALHTRVSLRSAALFVLAAAGLIATVSAATAAGPSSLRSLEQQRRAAVLELYAAESRVSAAQARLSSLQHEAEVLRAQQLSLQQQLGSTRITLTTSQQQLNDNLRRLYKQGDVNALAVVLGATSLDDAVSRLDSLSAFTKQSRRFVSVTTRAAHTLVRLRHGLVSRRARIAAAVSEAQRTVDDVVSARAARQAFVAHLQRAEQLKRTQIQALEASVQKAQHKAAVLTSRAASAPPSTAQPEPQDAVDAAPAPGASPASSGGRTVTVSSTGYSLPGHTATGLPVGWGVVAVDPSVIPLGTKLTIPGYGEAVAADTGGAVHGNVIDLWFPSLAQARAWGRRTITITLH